MQWSPEAIASMQEIFHLSPETLICMQQVATLLKTIPNEEQLRALDWVIRQIAEQRSTDVREVCYGVLRFHPFSLRPPDEFVLSDEVPPPDE